MKRIHTLRGPASGHLCTPTIASETNYPKPGLWTANLFFWTTGAMKDRQRCNHHRRIVGCVLSGARRVHPVIVGWSTPQIAPSCPAPSMIIPDACSLSHGLGQLPDKLGRRA